MGKEGKGEGERGRGRRGKRGEEGEEDGEGRRGRGGEGGEGREGERGRKEEEEGGGGERREKGREREERERERKEEHSSISVQFVSYIVHYLMTLDTGDGVDLEAVVNGMMTELCPHVRQLHARLGRGSTQPCMSQTNGTHQLEMHTSLQSGVIYCWVGSGANKQLQCLAISDPKSMHNLTTASPLKLTLGTTLGWVLHVCGHLHTARLDLRH